VREEEEEAEGKKGPDLKGIVPDWGHGNTHRPWGIV
jgi:hypothetical protein